MAPSTPLSIATSSVLRLVKEETSYHRELQQQTARIRSLEESVNVGPDEDGNREFMLKQERRALEETKAIFPRLRQKISDAVAKLDSLMVEEGQKGAESNVELIDAAKAAISQAKTAIREVS